MSHEIAETNGKSSIAFTGETPWHGLGQQLPEGAPFEVWLEASGMNFDIHSAEVIYKLDPAPTAAGSYRRLDRMPSKRVLYRGDTGNPVGLVSSRYKVVQPKEVLEFFRDLCADNKLVMETAGCLRGGSRYWTLAKTKESVAVGPKRAKDITNGYFLLSTSADGSLATTARKTAIRVVCNNTLTMATSRDHTGAFRNRHDSVFDVNAARTHLDLDTFGKEWEEWGKTLIALDKVKVDDATAAAWFRDLLRTPAEREKLAEMAAPQNLEAHSFTDLLNGNVRAQAPEATPIQKDVTPDSIIRKVAVLTDAYQNAPGAAPGTAYGLLQAATYYTDHASGARTPENRLNNAWFGNGEDLKNRAWADAIALLTKTA